MGSILGGSKKMKNIKGIGRWGLLAIAFIFFVGLMLVASRSPAMASIFTFPIVIGMAQLFAQHEADIVTLPPENSLIIIGNYTGSTDLATDKINADTEFAKLFPGRYKEETTENVSANTATLSGGAFDTALIPIVYKNDILLDEADYTFVAGTGVFSAFDPVLTGDDAITVTLVKQVFGAQSVASDADFPIKITDVKAIGTSDYVYRTTTYEDKKYTVNVKGAYDVRELRRTNPGNELQKAIFGAQWDATSAAANEITRNTNPFFVAIIWWFPDAASGEVEIEKTIFYGCKLTKGLNPHHEGTDKEASFDISAEALYAYMSKTLAS
jgi:hypothetical protein